MTEARCAMRIVRFESRCDLEGLRVADGFAAIVRTEHVPAMFARTLAARGTITAAIQGGVLVGYAADLPFVAIEWDGGKVDRRWDGLPEVRELGAVEVAAPFRNRGIAHELMRALAAEGRLDRYIGIAEALHWHWDLAAAGIDLWEYRRRLMRLLESAGFVRFETDAPDVVEHSANFLAARIGTGTAPVAQRAFTQALFQRAA